MPAPPPSSTSSSDSAALTFSWVAFESLEAHHHVAFAQILEEIRLSPRPGNVTRTYEDEVRTFLQPGLGKVLVGSQNAQIIGFLVAFERLNVPGKDGLPEERSKLYYDHPGRWYMGELETIGEFAFIFFLAVRRVSSGKGVGQALLNRAVDHFKGKEKVVVGAVVHEDNFDALRLLEKCGFEFIDLYRRGDKGSKKVIWFRAIKILQLKKVRETMDSERLHNAFRTAIPLQLNAAIRNLKPFLEKVNASITWATFFQLNPILEHEFGMLKTYNGHFQTLSTASEEEFRYVLRQLQRILQYFDQFEVDGITPISAGLIKKGKFELFSLNKGAELEEFGHFPNPFLLDINRPLEELESQIIAFQQEKNLIPEDESSQRTLREQWRKWLNVHKIIYETDKQVHGDDITWCHAVVPLSFSNGITGLMFSFIVTEADASPPLLNMIARNIADIAAGTMTNIILKPRDSVIRKYRARSAVATILLRNMAHNLGSHILARLAGFSILQEYLPPNQEMSGLVDFLTPGQLTSPEFVQWRELQAQLAKEKSVGMTTFLSYLRTRIDYLADIATSSPVASVALWLKSEVLEGFRQQEIVRHFISGVQKKEIRLTFENHIATDSTTDVLIQSPNGSLGCHAFYLLLENIIRNTAKHQSREFRQIQTLEVKVSVENAVKNNRYYCLRIADNIRRAYALPAHQTLVANLNEQFIEPELFDENDKIRQLGWGMLEMKIAAAYLRKIPGDRVDRVEGLPLLKAVEIPAPQLEGTEPAFFLGFEIYVKKPRKILLIDPDGHLSAETELEKKVREGVKIMGPQYFRSHPYEVQSHEMVILLGKTPRAEVEKQKLFPLRWIVIPDSEGIQALKQRLKTPAEELLKFSWGQWVSAYLRRKQLPDQPELLLYPPEKLSAKVLPAETLPELILFDYHGHALFRDQLLSPEQLNALLYYECFPTLSPTRLILESMGAAPQLLNPQAMDTSEPEFPHRLERLKLEIIEAALTRVIVLDERIQEAVAIQEPTFSIPNSDYVDQLAWMNIIVPRKSDVNLIDELYDKTELKRWLKAQLQAHKTDFLVIHFGIIEKLFGTGKAAVKLFIEKEVKSLDDRVEVVITSGRGKPNNISEQALFLHFSNVSKYLLNHRSKFHLVKELFSARTRLVNHE